MFFSVSSLFILTFYSLSSWTVPWHPWCCLKTQRCPVLGQRQGMEWCSRSSRRFVKRFLCNPLGARVSRYVFTMKNIWEWVLFPIKRTAQGLWSSQLVLARSLRDVTVHISIRLRSLTPGKGKDKENKELPKMKHVWIAAVTWREDAECVHLIPRQVIFAFWDKWVHQGAKTGSKRELLQLEK